jgi:hypothetical protein
MIGALEKEMRNTRSLTIVAILIALLAAVDTFADIRLRFARGRTSATVSGKVAEGGRVCYFAGAKSGQRLTATVSSRSGKVMILESGETSYSYEIQASGDQSICVDNIGRATTYSLTVSIR